MENEKPVLLKDLLIHIGQITAMEFSDMAFPLVLSCKMFYHDAKISEIWRREILLTGFREITALVTCSHDCTTSHSTRISIPELGKLKFEVCWYDLLREFGVLLISTGIITGQPSSLLLSVNNEGDAETDHYEVLQRPIHTKHYWSVEDVDGGYDLFTYRSVRKCEKL